MLIAVCGCLMCGCGEENTATSEQEQEYDELNLSSQMVLLERFDDSYSGLCYDKDTKIIYMYSCNYTNSRHYIVSYSPYYVIDMNDNVAFAIYNGDE